MAAAESTVWTWGRAKNYRLGRAFVGTDARVPEKVTGFEGVAVRQAACGGGHTAIVLEDCRLFVFGYSQYGQLGLGDRNDMCDATQVFLVAPSGVAANVPAANAGAVGGDGVAANGNGATLVSGASGGGGGVGGAAGAGAVSSGPSSLLGAGAGVGIGAGIGGGPTGNGVSGVGGRGSGVSARAAAAAAARHGATLQVAEVACGRYHTISRTTCGLVFTWGGGKNGRLGHGDEKIRAQPTCVEALAGERALSVTAGYHNNLVLTARGEVWSWGWGAHGQLGLGDVRDRDTPTVIEELSRERVRTLSCGDRHSFAVTEGGLVLGWGSNEFGQLGCGKKRDTVLRPTVIEGLRGLKVVAISSGDRHSAAVTNTGAVYTWGCGSDGQCGHGNFADVTRPKLVEGLSGKFVTQVRCGHNFTMVMTRTMEVLTWGNNTYGQLGNNGNGKSDLPVRVVIGSSARVAQVSCGHFHCIMWMEAGGKTDGPGGKKEGVLVKNGGRRAGGATAIDSAGEGGQLGGGGDSGAEATSRLEEARERLAGLLKAFGEKRGECRELLRREKTAEHVEV